MRTADEILKEASKDRGGWLATKDCLKAINTARIEVLKEVHSIIAAMDWDVMQNTIDAKELQSKINSLINEIK